MGYDIGNSTQGYYFNCNLWRRLLDLTYQFGWEPQGTLPVHKLEGRQKKFGVELEDLYAHLIEERGRGSYFTNDGHIVTRSDAAALAEALVRIVKSHEQDAVRDVIDFSLNREVDLGPEYSVDMFSEEIRRRKLPVVLVHRLMSLCRDGSFSIN